MSWERKLWEEEEKTQKLLEELSYSQEQRRLDELVYGEEALDEEWASAPQNSGSPVGWLLGSPYHRRLGGQVYAYLWFIGACLALALIAFGVRGWVSYQRAQQHQQLIQQLGNPHGSPAQPAPAGSPATTR